MAKKLPSMQWYTGDWLKDPCVGLCSAATRGIWVDLICAMHEADRCGQLTGTVPQLARLARCSEQEFSRALEELRVTKSADISRSHDFVTLKNRRMNREYNARNRGRQRQLRRRHGNVAPMSRESSAHPTGSSSSTSVNTGNTGAFANVTFALLRDTGALVAWRRANLGSEPSEDDLLFVVAAAERALEKGRNPASMFVRLVKQGLRKNISAGQEERASDRLKTLRNGHASDAAHSLADQLKPMEEP